MASLTVVKILVVLLQEFFDVVEQHFIARLSISKLSEQLEERAQQFRSIQKRLLVRFKVRFIKAHHTVTTGNA